MVDRVSRAMRLDRSLYIGVVGDLAGVLAAAQIVAFVALATTLGTGLTIAAGRELPSARPLGAIAGSIMAPFVHWLIWSALLYTIGTFLIHGRVSYPAVLTAIGYAMAPQALAIFGFLPIIGPVAVLLGQLLSLRAGSLAMQEALHLDSRRTIITIVVTFIAAFAISNAIRALLTHVGFWSAVIGPLNGAS